MKFRLFRPSQLTLQRSLLSIFCALTCASASAQPLTPAQALGYTSSDLVRAERDVLDAQRLLEQARLGISAGVELEPFLEVEGVNYLAEDSTRNTDFGANIGADLEYQYNITVILERTIELLEAQDRYENAQREGIRDALLSFVDLFRTRLDFDAAQTNLADSQANLAELEAAGDADEIVLSRARFEVEVDQLAFDQAQVDLGAAARDAATFGFEGELEFQPLVFLLPQVEAKDTYSYQIAELELAIASGSGIGVFNVLEEVAINAEYAGTDADFTARLFLEEAGPGASLEGDFHPFDSVDEDALDWSVGVSATFRFDTETLTSFDADEREIMDARARLEEVASEYQEDVAEALQAIDLALRDLALEQEGFEVSSRIVEELNRRLEVTFPQELDVLQVNLTSAQQQLEYYQERVNTETDEETRRSLNEQVTFYRTEVTDIQADIRTLEGQIQRVQQDLDRTNAELARRVDDIYGLWGTYVTRVHAYLTLVEEPWSLE
jgi:hypothetical protein